MRQVRKGRAYASKAVALFLVLVMALALPIMVHAAVEVPDGAMRFTVERLEEHLEFYVVGATRQRAVQDLEEVLTLAISITPWTLEGLAFRLFEAGFLNDDDGIVSYAMNHELDASNHEHIQQFAEAFSNYLEDGGSMGFYFELFSAMPIFYVNAATTIYLGSVTSDFYWWRALRITPFGSFSAIDFFCAGDCDKYSPVGWDDVLCNYYNGGGMVRFTTMAVGSYNIFLGSGGVPPIAILVVEDDTTQNVTPQPTALDLSTASSWARIAISEAYTEGLVPLALQSNFTQTTTRAEFAALAVALYEATTGNEITARAQFNDTTDINVQKLGGLSVVDGVGNGNFAPNSTITREQAAVLLARLAYVIGQPLPAAAPTFADSANVSAWAVVGVGQIQAAGIMGGVGDNNFAPGEAFTREQSIASVLHLFLIMEGYF